MDTASENNEPPITVLYIKPVEFSQHETDEVITILQSWNLSMSTCDIILAGGIYTIKHLECIEVEQVEEIFSGIGKTFIGEKAVFLNKLKAWRKDKNKPMVCDKQTESASQTSRILDWLENISTELSNLSRTSSIASGSHDFVETSLQNQYQLKPLLEGSVKGQFILSYYGKHNILDSKSQKDLCHIITDFYKNKKIRMTYADMGNWAKQIELLFPNEKSTTYFMPRKVGKKNPTGKLHSRWANIHEKTNENDCENIDHQLLIIEEENIGKLMEIKCWLSNNCSPWSEVCEKWEH